MAKFLFIFLIILPACASTQSTEIENRVNSAYNAYQVTCMAAEQSDEYNDACIRTAYHLCREVFVYQHRTWISSPWFGRYKNGYPSKILEMKIEMNDNDCRPSLDR